MLKNISLSILAAAMMAAACPPAFAAMQVHLLTFPGADNLPIWIAQDKGLFAKEGLDVAHAPTTGSKQEIKDLYAGKADIISTAFDNIVAYAEGQSEVPLPGPFDMVAVLGVRGGINSVVARPEIHGFAGIKGKTVAVDSAKSGYALVLYQILQKHGLIFGKDYTTLAVGGTKNRAAALEDGRAAAAVIDVTSDRPLQKRGFKILADVAKELGAYQGSAIVVRRPWAKVHEPELAAFIRAYVAATDYVFDHRNEAIAELKAHVKGLSDEDLGRLYDRLVGPGGLDKHAAIDLAGVENVLKIRETYGEPKKKMGPPTKYIDVSYAERALASH